MSETPSPPATLAEQVAEQAAHCGLSEALRWIAHAATGDAGRRTANKRPELAEIPGGALKLMASLLERLAGEIDTQGAAVEPDDATEREIAGAPLAERLPGDTYRAADFGVPAGTKLTTVFGDGSGAAIEHLGSAMTEAAETFHDGSPLKFVFDIVDPEPWEPETAAAAPPFPPGYFTDPVAANEHAPGSAPKA